MSLFSVSLVFLISFSLLSSFDTFYYHIFKFRLYRRQQSLKEHFFHTTNLLFYALSTFFLFGSYSYGLGLWLGLIFSVLFFCSEFLDLGCEKTSRADFGGVPTGEYLCHFAMGLCRGAYVALILFVHKKESWSLVASHRLPQSNFQSWLVTSLLILSFILFIFHLTTLISLWRSQAGRNKLSMF